MGLDFIELVVEIEDSFHVSFDDLDLEKVVTVGDLYSLLLQHIEEDDYTWKKFQHIFIEKVGVNLEDVRFEKRIINDLKID